MRKSVPALTLAVFSVAIVGALLTVNSEQPTLRPRPAGLYLVQAEDFGAEYAAIPGSARHFDRSMLALPDYYPEREQIPSGVLGLLGADPPPGASAVRLLEDWDWLELDAFDIAAPGAPVVAQAAAIFGSRPGASSAFAAALEGARAAGWRTASGIDPPDGDAVAVLERAAKGSEGAYLFLIRNVNLVQRIELQGGDVALSPAWAARAAGMAARKSRGQIAVRVATPSSSPTPAAAAPWVGRDGRRADAAVLRETAGPSHCGWQDVAMLAWEGATYARDVGGRFVASTPLRFQANGAMPQDAVDTGFRSGNRELWVPPGLRPAAVYIRMPGAVERWPRLDATCY